MKKLTLPSRNGSGPSTTGPTTVGPSQPQPNGTVDTATPFTAAVNSPIRTRQPRWMMFAGVAFLVVSVLAAIWLVQNLRETTEVLVMAKTVEQGQTITADSVRVVSINTDSGLAAVPKTQQDQVIGKQAATALTEGTLLNPRDVTVGIVPGVGQSLVGITVSQSKLPATDLVPGDNVRLVDTPRDQDDSPSQGPITTNAQVVAVKQLPEQQKITVDVLVPKDEASWVSARAATGRVAIILDSRRR